jgi:hypothetical protein
MIPTVVVLAAGMSTRYGRLKLLEPVGPDGEALLDYTVFDARRAGFSRVVLIIREELEEAFRAHIDPRWPSDLDVVFHHQKPEALPGSRVREGDGSRLARLLQRRRKPWGTAHALLSARELLPDPFVVLNADDFYGYSAFSLGASLIGGGMASNPWDPPAFGLVAYTLMDTLTGNGGVNRGICTVDREGWLEGVEEALDVKQEEASIVGSTLSGENLRLSGREPVSTNFWILAPEIFPHLEAGFWDFLMALTLHPGEGEGPVNPTSIREPEFLIPAEVNRLLKRGKARVRVFPSPDRFFGITHPLDWDWVEAGLQALTAAGQYPSPLWAPGSGGEAS